MSMEMNEIDGCHATCVVPMFFMHLCMYIHTHTLLFQVSAACDVPLPERMMYTRLSENTLFEALRLL